LRVSDRRRVLIVEDDRDNRELMTQILEDAGYAVVAVDDGADAIAFAAQDRPGLVVLDLKLRDVDGWTVLASMRAKPSLRDVPVLVVSALLRATVPPKVTFLKKPFLPAEFLALVAALFVG
jgi:CheY-like chemotaxis protein